MSRHGGASHRELRNESPAKLRQQKPHTATLGVHDPLPSPECEDVHHRLAKEKNYMDCSWDFVAQTRVSELGRRRNAPGKGEARRTPGSSTHPQPLPCSEIPFPVPGLSSDLQARGQGKCSLQNLSE